MATTDTHHNHNHTDKEAGHIGNGHGANGHGVNGHGTHQHYETSYGHGGAGASPGGMAFPGQMRAFEHRKFANPAPLGLCAFALTTFVLSCVNMHARGVSEPNIVVTVAFAYGGLVQLLAGMW